jgi:hypothetical protein
MAREIVKYHFKDTFTSDIDWDVPHNSDQEAKAISEKVQRVIKNSLFLQGPLDAQVSCHPFFGRLSLTN